MALKEFNSDPEGFIRDRITDEEFLLEIDRLLDETSRAGKELLKELTERLNLDPKYLASERNKYLNSQPLDNNIQTNK